MMSLTFGLFTQVSDSGPQGHLVFSTFNWSFSHYWYSDNILLAVSYFHSFTSIKNNARIYLDCETLVLVI